MECAIKMEYGMMLWRGTLSSCNSLKPIIIIQKRIIQIQNYKSASAQTAPHFKILNILKFWNLFIRKC